jgi:uncharacterized membrane protein YdfJ with MMPL/SSD domain
LPTAVRRPSSGSGEAPEPLCRHRRSRAGPIRLLPPQLVEMTREQRRSAIHSLGCASGLLATSRTKPSRRDDPDPIAQMFGIGLAFAVLIDATIVRAVLVPAAMVLLGDANWWLPSWLDRILPRMQLEVAEPEMDEELDAPSLATDR